MTSPRLFVLTFGSICLHISPNILLSQDLQWQQGNGPYEGGVIHSMITDSFGNLLTCTPGPDGGGGVYRSTDAGYTWRQIYAGTQYIDYMTIDHNDNIYVSVGGIAFSSDAGEHWEVRNNGLPSFLDVTVIGTTSTNVVLAATWEPPWSPALYRSTNQGISWTQVTTCPLDSTAVSIAVSATGEIYMGTVGSKVYRSSDDGATWTILYPNASYIRGILISPNGSVFLGANNGVFRSTDNGTTWIRILNPAGLTITNTAIVYASWSANGWIGKSTDNGNTWSQIPAPPAIMGLSWHSSGALFGNWAGRGVRVTRDEGNTWEVAPIPIMIIYSLAVKVDGMLFAGTDNGFFRSTNSGASWEAKPVQPGLPYPYSQNSILDIVTSQSGVIFVAAYGAGIWKSTNGGEQWTHSLPSTLELPDGYSLAVDSIGNIYAGMAYYLYHGTVYKSTNNGLTWEERSQGLPTRTVRGMICISDQILLAAPWGVGVFRTTNGGDTWIASSAGLPANSRIFSFAKANTGLIFSCTMDSGAYVSSNGGMSWTRSNSGITTPTIYRIATNSSGTLFAGTSSGVFRSTNYGQTWTDFTAGLAKPLVLSLVSDHLGYLHAGTAGGSTFRTIQSTTNVESKPFQLPLSFHLAHNYPNPFNGTTRIEFTLPYDGHVTAKVYDILGRELYTITDGRFTLGRHSIEWDAGDLPSGIYFYQLQIDNVVKSKKAILLK